MTAAALSLAVCAALQLTLFVLLAASSKGDSYVTSVGYTVTFWGFVGFAAAASWVWRGLRGARVMTWLVASIAAPACGAFDYALVGFVTSGNAGLAIVFGLSTLALVLGLVFLLVPSSNAHFRAIDRSGRSRA
ncbi:hypothetical protein ABT369_29970 [Dactylosporangium sp. NPDC000244]|uniref:hypothetical protein n=1 Tax=Dactylosporangium sp. NPDC000244 TaxID=3154365 RepID=UPI00332C7C44